MEKQDAARRRFEAVFSANSQIVFDYARRRTASTADAADVMAETMLVAWRRIGDVPPGDEARLWLYGVARRVLSNHRRSLQRRDRLGQRIRQTLLRDVEIAFDGEPDLEAVNTALDRLAPDDRELIVLASWERLNSGEIAVVLGVSPGAVRVRLHRARTRLRVAMSLVVPATSDPNLRRL